MLNQDLLMPPADFTYLEEAPSGMDVAAAQARVGAAHLSAVFTENQIKGRGRRGRRWHNFVGCNIALSLIIREGTSSQLPLVAALAVHDALTEQGAQPAIKWPNDILLNGQKVCGLLVESIAGCEAKILGIGLNVLVPAEVPADFAGTFVNAHLAQLTTREPVLNSLFNALQKRLAVFAAQGWPALATEYEQHCITLGQTVTWHDEGGTLVGVAERLEADGALILRDAHNQQHAVQAGDISAQGQTHR